MGKSSGTSSRASMLVEPPGLCSDRKSDTSMLASPSAAGGGSGAVPVALAMGKVCEWATEDDDEEDGGQVEEGDGANDVVDDNADGWSAACVCPASASGSSGWEEQHCEGAEEGWGGGTGAAVGAGAGAGTAVVAVGGGSGG